MANVWEVEAHDVSLLASDAAKKLLNRLLRAERRIHSPDSEVLTSDRNDVADRGVDALVRGWTGETIWIPKGNSVWQMKASKYLPSEKEARAEARKPGVLETVRDGGAYRYVVTGDPVSPGLNKLHGWIHHEVSEQLKEAIVPDRIRALNASDLAEWVTGHPAFLFEFRQPAAGFWRADSWLLQQTEHRTPYQDIVDRRAIFEAIQSIGGADGPWHMRIEGPPGVGKTRLVLEALSNDGLDLVLFSDGMPATREFFVWLSNHPTASAVLIADECEPKDSGTLQQYADMCGGRLRILSIGWEIPGAGPSPGVISLGRVDDEETTRIAQAAAGITHEQARFIATLSHGDLRLATALAFEVARESLTVTEIANSGAIVGLVDRLVKPEHRQMVKAMSLLRRVGWDGDLQDEGKAVCTFIGIPWEAARTMVGELVTSGIVGRQGRYRYVRSDIMAIRFAGELVRERREDIVKFINALPPGDCVRSAIARLGDLAGLPEAEGLVKELEGPAGPFADFATLNAELSSSLFRALSPAAPEAALATLEAVLEVRSVEQLRAFSEGRRNTVWTLQELAEYTSTFYRAGRLLFKLALAENETWSNNASGVWASLFLTHLGATEVPALERYVLIEELVGVGSREAIELALNALQSALTVSEIGEPLRTSGARVPPARWQPKTWGEDRQCRRAALDILDRFTESADSDLRRRAREVLIGASRSLASIGLGEDVLKRIEAWHVRDDADRFQIWKGLSALVRYERAYLSPEQVERAKDAADKIFGQSLSDRLRRYIGQWSHADWPKEGDEPETYEDRLNEQSAELAEAILLDPAELGRELPWLTSGEAVYSYALGLALGERDHGNVIFDMLQEAAREAKDVRVISGYLESRRRIDPEFVEQVLDEWSQDKSLAAASFDASWRGTGSDRAANRIVNLVERHFVEPSALAVLHIGRWELGVTAPALASVIRVLMLDQSPSATEGGIALIFGRGKLEPELAELAWELLERGGGSGSGMYSYYWAGVARRLLDSDPKRVTDLIMRALASDRVPRNDERMKVLHESIQVAPLDAWRIVSECLLREGHRSIRLAWTLKDGAVVDQFPEDIILDWVEAADEDQATLLARVIHVGDRLSPVARSLIKKWGPESDPAREIEANFRSGMFSGPMSSWEERLLAIAESWKKDPDDSIRAFASNIAEYIRESLPHTQIVEAERGY